MIFLRYDDAINNSESAKFFPDRATSIKNYIKEAFNPSHPQPTMASETIAKSAVIIMGTLLLPHYKNRLVSAPKILQIHNQWNSENISIE